MLLPNRVHELDDCLTALHRTGLIEHFDPKEIPPQAENGISILAAVRTGRHTQQTLFDLGLTGSVLSHNLVALRRDPAAIDHVVISHGHPDHYGGIARFLEMLSRPIPVATHPQAFLPRYALMSDGRASAFYNQAFQQEDLERRGARLVLSKEPLELGWGILTTGEIPRVVDFEGPPKSMSRGDPGLYQVSEDGQYRIDEVWDEQGLIIDVKGEGLVVLTGCAHAGVVNTILRAREICGEKPIRAVLGGFHLGFPTTPTENVEKTVEALRDLDVRVIVPMHCSGLNAHRQFMDVLPTRYVQPAVGTTLMIGS
jgi:7,8-dihydropterin-6-yl-methyl-4-(beta-D-ribofuranosyl)aminobenzene 5'-phosphate synthase